MCPDFPPSLLSLLLNINYQLQVFFTILNSILGFMNISCRWQIPSSCGFGSAVAVFCSPCALKIPQHVKCALAKRQKCDSMTAEFSAHNMKIGCTEWLRSRLVVTQSGKIKKSKSINLKDANEAKESHSWVKSNSSVAFKRPSALHNITAFILSPG